MVAMPFPPRPNKQIVPKVLHGPPLVGSHEAGNGGSRFANNQFLYVTFQKHPPIEARQRSQSLNWA